jgi:hypothetical protein
MKKKHKKYKHKNKNKTEQTSKQTNKQKRPGTLPYDLTQQEKLAMITCRDPHSY